MTINMLFPNQFVNARLLVDTLHDAVIVPAAAVQQGPNGTLVYVVGPESTVEVRQVLVGPTEGDETAITTGLFPGDVVVVDGVDKLQQGTKVALRERATAADRAPAGDRSARWRRCSCCKRCPWLGRCPRG